MFKIVFLLGSVLFLVFGFSFFFKQYLSDAIKKTKQEESIKPNTETPITIETESDNKQKLKFTQLSIEGKGSLGNVVVVSFELSNETNSPVTEDFVIQCGDIYKEFKDVSLKENQKINYKDIILGYGVPSNCAKVGTLIQKKVTSSDKNKDTSTTTPLSDGTALPAPKL